MAEKLVRASKKEMRTIKRKVNVVKRKEKEELKALLGSVINEIDRGQIQLIKTLRKIDDD